MDKPVIGIRQADGSFYEIMSDEQGGRKRLVLSAARQDQNDVKIDLFRSTDGGLEGAVPLGSMTLDDPDGLGFQDIEFRLDLKDDGQLEASAALPGHAPVTLSVDLSPYREAPDAVVLPEPDAAPDLGDEPEPEAMTLDLPDADEVRSDAERLEDETVADTELDVLDDSFLQDPEPEGPAEALPTLDPELSMDPEEEIRSDSERLSDDSFDSVELDSLGDLEEPAPGAGDEMDIAMDDFDAGFGEPDAAQAPEAPEAGAPAAAPAEDDEWEKISLDDMEPMEFMDTGEEISKPKAAPKKPAVTDDDGLPALSNDEDFSFGDDEPLELADTDSDTDFGDLPDFGDDSPSTEAASAGSDSDFDQDFMASDTADEPLDWDEAEPAAAPPPARGKEAKPAKEARPPKPAKAAKAAGSRLREAPADNGGLDKTALFLSLSALSLLVLLILVLLFLNMIKPPQPSVVAPEVQRWTPPNTTLGAAPPPSPAELDLAAIEPVVFEASSVLEIPAPLRTARVTYSPAQGEGAADAARLFGPPATAEGSPLRW